MAHFKITVTRWVIEKKSFDVEAVDDVDAIEKVKLSSNEPGLNWWRDVTDHMVEIADDETHF